ncbi:MAG: sensor histidine kinase [Coriobacteriia bacterium]
MSGRSGRPSIVRRTRLGMVAVAALSALVVFVVFYFAWLAYTVDVRGDELSRQVSALAKGVSAGGPLAGATRQGALRVQLFRVQAGLIGARLAITDADGTVSLSTADAGQGPDVIAIDSLGEADGRGVRRAVRTVPESGRLLVVAAPLEGGGWLVALQAVREIAAARTGVALLLLGSMGVALLVAWIAGAYVARQLTAPLVRLRIGAEAIASGEWGHQVAVEGDLEITSLAESFNRMSGRVADAYAAQKDFVGDVSHELRTPITSIQGFAGALSDGIVTDPETAARFLGVIRQEAQRLGDLTTTLLALADLDAGRVELARMPVDTSALAETLRVRHAGPDVDLAVGDLGPEGSVPLADDARVLQVASALVSNAVRYTPSGGTVSVSAESGEGSWRLHVDDSGPGIPPESRERIFERFVRLDSARTSTEGGSGLGLSICSRLVDLMDGSISVDDSPLGGARFTVTLPVARE